MGWTSGGVVAVQGSVRLRQGVACNAQGPQCTGPGCVQPPPVHLPSPWLPPHFTPTGCLPAGLHRAAVAVLLFLGGLLPAAAIYKAEARARHRFLAASAPLLGARARQLGAAATE